MLQSEVAAAGKVDNSADIRMLDGKEQVLVALALRTD